MNILSGRYKGLEINITDERNKKERVFQYQGGIVSFVRYLNYKKEVIRSFLSKITKNYVLGHFLSIIQKNISKIRSGTLISKIELI